MPCTADQKNMLGRCLKKVPQSVLNFIHDGEKWWVHVACRSQQAIQYMHIVTLSVNSWCFTAEIATRTSAHQEEVKSGQPAPLDEHFLAQDPSEDDLGPALKDPSTISPAVPCST